MVSAARTAQPSPACANLNGMTMFSEWWAVVAVILLGVFCAHILALWLQWNGKTESEYLRAAWRCKWTLLLITSVKSAIIFGLLMPLKIGSASVIAFVHESQWIPDTSWLIWWVALFYLSLAMGYPKRQKEN
jgi:phosphatidylglycerophosphate synthase